MNILTRVLYFSGLLLIPALVANQSGLRMEVMASPSAIGDGSDVRLRIIAPKNIGARVAVLDGFRIAGYVTVGPEGVAEYTLAQPAPGQHWLRAQVAGKQGERSAAIPLAVSAAGSQQDLSANEFAIRAGQERSRAILMDLNQDNIQDRVVVNGTSLSVELGDGRGGFSASREVPDVRKPVEFFGGSSVSDWNEDGFPDLAIGSTDGVLLCFGDGEGGFQATRWITEVQLPAGEMAGDLDGDRHADLVILQKAVNGWILAGLFGTGDGTMTLRPLASDMDAPAAWNGKLEVADRDGDGIIDFIQSGEDSPLRWRRASAGGFRLDTAKPATAGPLAAAASPQTERAATTWGTTYYGQILTIAGGGEGTPGDGGLATAAKLARASSILLDTAQNLYFTEGSRVRKVTKATGIISTIAGGGAHGSPGDGDGGLATSAFMDPKSVARDSAGNLYISDFYRHRIRKVDAASAIITNFAGSGDGYGGGFLGGFGGDGQLAPNAQLSQPRGVAVDGAGNLYIADSGNQRIRRVSALSGIIETVAGTGTLGSSGDGAAATSANLNYPIAVRVDSAGNLIFADYQNGRVRKVTTASGIISTVAGGGPLYPATGVQATAASLNYVLDLGLDSLGSIIFSENFNLWKVDSTNSLYSLLPIEVCCSSTYSPGVIALDNSGNLVFSATGSYSVNSLKILDLTSTKFVLSQTRVDVNGAAGTATVDVTSDPVGGQWTATSDMSWLQVSPTSGTGAATLTYTYTAPGSVNSRIAKVVVNGQVLTVYQSGAIPTFILNPNSATLGGQAANGTLSMTVTPSDSQWVAYGNPTWLTVAPSSGIGSATISFGAPANLSTDARTGKFTVQRTSYDSTTTANFTVTQSAAATAAFSSASSNVGAGAGSVAIQLTTTPDAASWSAQSDSAWLIVTPITGTGTASLALSHMRNNAAKARTGTISVGGQKFTVTQAASPVAYSLWPTSWWGQLFTIGGGGTASPDDGGPATSVRLSPGNIAVDGAGNVFFTENEIYLRRIDSTTGIISRVGHPFAAGLATDLAGDLYYSSNSSVYKLSRSGSDPQLIAGGGLTLGDGGSAVAAQLENPRGLALDGAGSLFIAETGRHRVRHVNLATGIITTVAGTGTAGFSGDGGRGVNAQLNYPSGVALDAVGNLYVADNTNFRIRKVAASTGLISTFAGGGTAEVGDDAPATNAKIHDVRDVKFSPDGAIYFSDFEPWGNGSRIRRVDPSTGIITTVAGGRVGPDGLDGDSAVGKTIAGGATIAFDSIGNLYFADRSIGRIRYIDYVSPRSSLSSNTLTVSAAAGSGTVQLTSPASTGAWKLTVQDPSWFTVGITSGTGDTTLTFSYTANSSSSPRTGTFTVRGQLFTLTQSGVTSLTLDRSSLYFGATRGGGVVSPPETVSITQNSGLLPAPWSITTDQSWCQVTPLTGTGSGKITISVDGKALPAALNSTCRVTLAVPGASPSTYAVYAYLKQSGPTISAPFGAFDTPVDNVKNVAGNIAVTGWALDDVGVNKVTLWRDPVGPEPTHGNGYVYIADALFVPGARPDVESANPTRPNANRAGWGYLLLTNGLPNGSGPKGNGNFKLHAIATDEEGNQTKLGTKTITVDNFNSVTPFGTLDTPTAGQIISGTFLNWGWAMTPKPASIAIDGSKIWVGVDGVNFAHPVYGIKRADIAAAFPGYANSESGVGAYHLDTTKFSNGMHNLGWLVYDNLGRGDGIGSRFIQIQNSAVATSADPEPVATEERAAHLRTARLQRPTAPAAGYPAFRSGYDLDAALTPIRQAGGGLLEPIELKELDRLEIHLPGGKQWTAALLVENELRALPIGSTFDAEGGIFYWQIGPVFLGEYVLEFRAADGLVQAVPVRVGTTAVPKSAE